MISWNLGTRSVLPIGLDIGHSSIKMIQLALSSGHMSVVAADKIRLDPGINGDPQARKDAVVSAIRQMLAKQYFRGRGVVSSLPNDKLRITSLRLSQPEFENVGRALRKEAVQRFGLDPEKDSINYMVAGSVRQGEETRNELILFAASDESIREHISLVEEAGLRPVAIDAIPCALFRGFERRQRRQEDRERTVVFVDVGSRFTTVVFGRGGDIIFIKQIPIGGERFTREVAQKLGLSLPEAQRLREKLWLERASNGPKAGRAVQEDCGDEGKIDSATREAVVDAISSAVTELAREISLCLRYFTVTFRGRRVERAVFSGGEAYESILLSVLKNQLTVEISVAEPLKGFDLSSSRGSMSLDNDRRGLLCEWAVAVGLGLKAANTK